MNDKLKSKILKVLIGRAGTVLTGLLTAAASAIVTKLTAFVPFLAEYLRPEDVFFVLWVAAIGAVNHYTNKWQGGNTVLIQEALKDAGLLEVVDGVAGPKTVEGVKRGVRATGFTAVDGAPIMEGDELTFVLMLTTGRQRCSGVVAWSDTAAAYVIETKEDGIITFDDSRIVGFMPGNKDGSVFVRVIK